MKKLLEMSLGIVTSIGGFLEIGSIATAAQAGAEFGYQLLWAIALGGICVIFLVEQGGRLSAVSKHAVPGAIRERFGFNYFVLLFFVVGLVSLLVFTAEIGGICIAIEMATGIRFWWWAAPVGFVVWLLMWKGPFSVIEKGVSLLGLVTISFIVGAYLMHPDWSSVARGAVPSTPDHNSARYWFLAVSILGASISPYLFFFYSSGAVEDHWDESYLSTNRIIAASGMSFGSVMSIAVLILAALVFPPRGLKADEYSQLALLLQDAFGYWGFILLIVSLGIACLGAALEIALELAYLAAQGFGWNWSKNQRPREEARFSIVYMIVILIGVVIIACGVDPLQLTVMSMALTAATLPISIAPFLFIMNDPHYVATYRNGWFSNTVVILIIALASILAIVTIPLQIFGGG
jgi:NRAMP (natural resistance-associated macrophage protein)-like metal ion transporter